MIQGLFARSEDAQHVKIRSLLVGAGALMFLFLSAVGQDAFPGPKSRIVGPIDDSDVVTLQGNTHPLARPEFDRGVIRSETRMERLVLVLQPGEGAQRQLESLVEAQQQPGSSEYHQWLSPAEFGSRFGASAEEVARVSAWLTKQGFRVEPIAAGRRLLIFSGTEAQVEDAFHTEIHRYEMNGDSHIANSQDPQIPRALAPVVAGILSLHDFRRKSEIAGIAAVLPEADGYVRQAIAPENTQSNGAHYLFPADFATIYDLNPLYAAGTSGKGASIAIVGRSNINLSDVSTFRSFAGLTTPTPPVVILDGANPGLVSGDQDESTLDVEWSGAVAPAAAVTLVVAASTATTDGVDLSAQYIVNHKTASVMSTSFGSCEANLGATEMAFYNSLWQQAASEGISAFVSSGDSGAAGCDAGSSSRGTAAAINGLCSSPYATCVGGTQFNEGSGKYWAASNGAGGGSALGYIPEKVWNESGSNLGLWASGGGASIVYAQPSWQSEVSGANHNGMRTVPDVALSASMHDGYLVCENGSFYIFGGTSASSPSFAGIMALVVQAKGLASQGSANPGLYSLLLASANPFHTTTVGNNTVPGVTGYAAGGAPFNLATGLGSVDARLMASQWSLTGSGVMPGFSMTPSVPSEALLPGRSIQFTLKAASTGGFAGAVNLTATAPTGVTVSFSATSIKPGQTVTATLTVAVSAQPGAKSVTITGTSGPLVARIAFPVTVLAPPTLSVSAGVVSLPLARGKAAPLAVKVVTGGTFSGTVVLALSGLPAGVTAKWSQSSFSLGAASTASTVTLTAASTTALASTKLSITAAGGGLTAQTTVTLQVTQ